ncbi:DUF4232 domain-containing protein [Streptomyces sp. NPDC091272]|uniref:DUF4232 domain-containing protein n=1 Tax=Streptomyces sp. NPDC091272 TaxID=3365981 RepID=UPI003828E711
MGARTSVRAAAVLLLGTMALTGCDGFLVPAGEGEQRSAGSDAPPSPTRTAARGGRGATTPPQPPAGRPATPMQPPAGRPAAPSETAAARPGRPAAPPAPARPPGASYSPPVAQDCPAGLRVDMGEIQAALMHRLATLTLTNCGSTPYKLSGRPSVKAYDAEGRALDVEVNVREEGKKTDTVVVLPPGGVAYSRLDWRPYDGVEEARALEIAAGPGHHARSFTLADDVRMVDAFDVTPWAPGRPR